MNDKNQPSHAWTNIIRDAKQLFESIKTGAIELIDHCKTNSDSKPSDHEHQAPSTTVEAPPPVRSVTPPVAPDFAPKDETKPVVPDSSDVNPTSVDSDVTKKDDSEAPK